MLASLTCSFTKLIVVAKLFRIIGPPLQEAVQAVGLKAIDNCLLGEKKPPFAVAVV